MVDEPVFGSYLFVAGDDAGIRNDAMSAAPGRLRHGIPIPDASALIRDLSQLLNAIESGAPLGKERAAPKAGDRYRVVDGPWEGTEGTLERAMHGGEMLLLHVHAIGRVVEMEVESWRVELIQGEDDRA